MEDRLNKLYDEISSILSNAPDEEDCSDEENEMYSDMVNLKASLLDAGYGDLKNN